MKLAALTIAFILFAFAGCGAVRDTTPRDINPDRPSATPTNPDRPTNTPTNVPPTPTPTNPDRVGVTPDDDPPMPSSTHLPNDWPTTTSTPAGYTTPTATPNGDQIYLTALAGTPSQTPDVDDRATHYALEQTMEAP